MINSPCRCLALPVWGGQMILQRSTFQPPARVLGQPGCQQYRFGPWQEAGAGRHVETVWMLSWGRKWPPCCLLTSWVPLYELSKTKAAGRRQSTTCRNLRKMLACLAHLSWIRPKSRRQLCRSDTWNDILVFTGWVTLGRQRTGLLAVSFWLCDNSCPSLLTPFMPAPEKHPGPEVERGFVSLDLLRGDSE